MFKVILWSRSFFPKVFGGVFGVVSLSTYSFADNKIAAINAAKNAAMITTGVSSQLKKIQKEYQNVFVKELNELNVKEPVFVFGAILKTAHDKRIEFIYRGNSFSITPNSMTVRIPF